jgi:hypothetical protein
MTDYQSILYPQPADFPEAIPRVSDAPENAQLIRLTAGAKNINRLRELPRLKRLWCFHIRQDALERICDCEELEYLYIDTLNSTDLRPLQRLSKLQILSINANTKIDSLEHLRALRQLHGLALIHFREVRSLDPIADLTELHGLVIAGSMWTRMRVDTLKPLGALTRLRYLDLGNLKAADEDLKPLRSLTSLEELNIPNFYPTEEFARLAGYLPNTRCHWFNPYVEFNVAPCSKCGSWSRVMLSGKGKPVICRLCDKKRLDKHTAHYHSLVTADAAISQPNQPSHSP